MQIEQVDYENEKAVGVTFKTRMDVEKLRVFVGEESRTSVIGVIVSEKDEHHFTPVIPFSQGQTYTLRKYDTLVLASFSIPNNNRGEPAELLAIYPSLDTVPENLLKIYLQFAQPMQQVGNALDFISVTNETDKLQTAPFLELESELWNKEHTVLTLWLDPGRIKTDLIPNKEKGLPLTAGNTYSIQIDSSWKSSDGSPLKQPYRKKFLVGPRDDRQPTIRDWELQLQDEDSLQSLYIDFGEPMDAFLAKETIRVYDLNDKQISGEFHLSQNQGLLRFVPEREFQTPEIELRIESRLEDLAGNNLNRLFDTPVSAKDPQNNGNQEFHTIRFKLHR